MTDSLLSGVLLLVILGIAALLLGIMWRQHKSDTATITQLQAEQADTSSYLKNLATAIDADGALLLHIQDARMMASILAVNGQPVLTRYPEVARWIKANDEYLGRVLAAVVENNPALIEQLRTALDHNWPADETYHQLEPYLARANA